MLQGKKPAFFIAKALQLLEYLIKNGSERVVDNARDHIYELKALKSFFYVDEKGKDQGINGIILVVVLVLGCVWLCCWFAAYRVLFDRSVDLPTKLQDSL